MMTVHCQTDTQKPRFPGERPPAPPNESSANFRITYEKGGWRRGAVLRGRAKWDPRVPSAAQELRSGETGSVGPEVMASTRAPVGLATACTQPGGRRA